MHRIVPAASEHKWGLLVKSWATGENYIEPGSAPIPLPYTYDDFKKCCDDLDLRLELPDWIKAVVFVQPSRAALTIRLPPKEIVKENEEGFDAGSTYEIPSFYADFFDGNFNPPQTKEEKKKLHALRIGDYSISMCA